MPASLELSSLIRDINRETTLVESHMVELTTAVSRLANYTERLEREVAGLRMENNSIWHQLNPEGMGG